LFNNTDLIFRQLQITTLVSESLRPTAFLPFIPCASFCKPVPPSGMPLTPGGPFPRYCHC
jgi:hypothetical protein